MLKMENFFDLFDSFILNINFVIITSFKFQTS